MVSRIKLQVYTKISHLLDLLVDNDANSMLGYIVHTPRFAMITLVRHSFLDCTCTLKKPKYEITEHRISTTSNQIWRIASRLKKNCKIKSSISP